MADLIERYKITANLPSVMMNYCSKFNSKQIELITEMIYELENSIESADVQTVRRGKWEKKRGYLVCSNCGMTVDTIGYTYEEQEEVFRYCSCCGYRMDGNMRGEDNG